ncbi:MAG: NAD-dependent epimerase/dehydratase family protein [Phycisphaerales bacterium]|jgi:2'-hydroxyisoflavone reductase|nr:NAD-dependent epimerase/dehydratase family protein [Phycisphaerales bacterium]
MHTRRQFLHASLAAGSLAALSGTASLAGTRARRAPMRVLILGGTGFLGPHCISAALARGHSVTIFNRGRTEERRKDAGFDSVVPEGVEVLYGNRDPSLSADAGKPDPDPDAPVGLTQLEGRKWDGVIDTSGYWPRIVAASAKLLAPNVERYLFVSSISAFAQNDIIGMDESAPVGTLDEPEREEFGDDFSRYGPAKAACESAAEAALPGRAINVRPGYIVGPRDTSRRWIYWPARVARGGAMVVPGTPNDPVQIIDVRDLAEFLVKLLEDRARGVFNATGPAGGMTMIDMIAGCNEGLGANASPAWIPAEFLGEQGLDPSRFPIWIPPEGETAGFHRINVKKAIAAGLTFRPVSDTARATMDWLKNYPADMQERLVPPLPTQDQEDAIIKAWKENGG